jgi:CheY-like chemotaxis protein/anti-sigma regulatory factor (Ser/Thr protein kinase)
VKIRDVIAAAIETVTPSAAANNIQVVAPPVDEHLTLLADTDRLQQVVWNLLSNSVKFTPKGGRVEVRAERRGADVCVIVSDTGEGIRRNVLPFLFEPFRQADASTARRHGGLGLGLAIVRQLVVAHGGTVQADSDGEGKGATFTVQIPARAVVPAFRGPSATSAGLGDNGTDDDTPRLDGLRLLVVDDEHDALTLLSEALGDQGAEVHAASSAREALDALPRVRPHVLVSDISMPDMDGLALMRAVRGRAAEQGGQTPAIALTAFTRDQDVKRALSAGYQVHLAKPVEIAPLARTIVKLARPAADVGS